MPEPLAVYLHDHLAGARLALELLEDMQKQHAGEPLEDFASKLFKEVSEDRDVVERLARRVGAAKLHPMKDSVAWLSEKATRWKLNRRTQNGLGTLQSLEMISVGILGKLALWKALAEVAPADNQLQGEDYQQLANRARHQHEQVEEHRLRVARTTLRGVSTNEHTK